MVGAATCSTSASSPGDFGPPNTSTDSTDARAGVSAMSGSSRRTRRSRWMAAPCTRAAISDLRIYLAKLNIFQDPRKETFMLSTIKQIAVVVADLEKSKAFYGNQLGLKQVLDIPGQLS